MEPGGKETPLRIEKAPLELATRTRVRKRAKVRLDRLGHNQHVYMMVAL